jgi:hypothetical protein
MAGSAERRLPGCDGVPSLHFRLDHLAAQDCERLLAGFNHQTFDQSGALQPRRVRQALETDAEITKPVIALLLERQYQRKV